MPSLLDKLRALPATPAPTEAPRVVEERRDLFGHVPVGPSEDLTRILALPRRVLDPADPKAAERWTAALRKTDAPCDCKERWGFCIQQLMPIQGWALEEASHVGGLLGLVAVGGGKTGLDILLPLVVPGCKTAVLLIPPNLKHQLLARDLPQWSAHWKVPNLAGGRYFTQGLPTLHVVAYSELSSAKATDLLRRIRPDLVIADECHQLKHRTAARTRRLLRQFSENPETRLCALSGTVTNRSLLDYGHLASHALGGRSPLPLHPSVLEEWAGALDAETAHTVAAPAGALRQLCTPLEHVRVGFRRRLVESPGVVATSESSLGTSLVLDNRPLQTPPDVSLALEIVRDTWQRPDGEELTEAMQKARVCQELAAGVYLRWIWPRMEPEALILEWLDARKVWHKELREKLRFGGEGMDSPLLCARAAARWYAGERGHATWASTYWPRWQSIKDKCIPETEAVWVSDYLVRDAAGWAAESPGIVWYSNDAVGRKIAEIGKLPFFGPGAEASAAILRETGNRSIVASLRAHGEGKNLQVFNRCLFAQFPTNPEQNIGRLHRPGQQADEVTAYFYRHTPELRDAFDTAWKRAQYVYSTTKMAQKLLVASRTW